MVSGCFIQNKRFSLRGVFSLVVAATVSACVYAATPDQLSNWQDDPKACAEFWDTYFPKALNGDDVAAASLFRAIIQRQLVPPGRPVDEYRQEHMEFDLLALKRLSIHKYKRPTGNAPVSPWSEAILNPSPKGRPSPYGASDPNDVLANKDREILSKFQKGLCPGDSTSEVWAAACRQILADDGVLPSLEEFIATIPAGAKACGFKGE